MKNLVRLALIAIFIVAFTISSAIVGAAVKIFDGKGEWHTSDAENQQIAMARASQRARLDAQKKAGVYLKTFSRSVNLELVDDEISAVTNNIIEIVGDVHFDKKIIPLSDNQTTILYTATLKARIDTEGIYDFVRRDNKDKITIIQQNTQLQDAIQKNDELSASLTKQYNRATSQAEKDRLRKQMNDADSDFLANQKYDKSLKLYYTKNYNGAIKFCNEAIELKPNWSYPYIGRAACYSKLKNYDRAIQDVTKAIQLDPKFALSYYNRGVIYSDLEKYGQAIQDYSKAIQLNPNYSEAYNNRGVCYAKQQNYEQAIRDFNKAIEINPNFAEAYNNRGMTYDFFIKNLDKALTDYSKAIQLDPNNVEAINNRGIVYARTKKFNLAIQDFSKCIQLRPNEFTGYRLRAMSYYDSRQYDRAIQDFTKSVQLNSKDARAYQLRGLCYQALGENAKAQADFAKAKQLGLKG